VGKLARGQGEMLGRDAVAPLPNERINSLYLKVVGPPGFEPGTKEL